MTINLYDILQTVLNESVDQSAVIDAIENKYQVWVRYSDEENHAPGVRLIEPYVYGISKAGNPILRAFLWKGDSYRGAPRYETLRLDRIQDWKPRKDHPFTTDPRTAGANVPSYNTTGDKSMTSIISQVKFDSSSLYQPTLDALRGRTDALKNLGKVNVKKSDTGKFEDMPYQQIKRNVFNRKGKYGGIDYDMVRRNLASTEKSKSDWDDIWKQVDNDTSLNQQQQQQQNNTQNNSGPIDDEHSDARNFKGKFNK